MSWCDPQVLARVLFDGGDALILFDAGTDQVLDVNAAAQQLTGFSRKELLALQAPGLFYFRTREDEERLREASQSGNQALEGYYLRTRKQGEWVPISMTVTRLDGQARPLALITARDIRKQREVRDQLTAKEAELKRVLASIEECFWTAEIEETGEWCYRFISPVSARITGRPPKYFMPGLHRWWKVIHPPDRPRCEKMIQRLRAGQACLEEYRVVWPDGSLHWVRDRVRVARPPDRRTFWLEGMMVDVTERKRAEETLRLRNRALQAIAEGIFLLDPTKADEPLIYANAALERITGHSAQEVLGRCWRSLFCVGADSQPLSELERAVREQRWSAVKLPSRRKDDTPIWLAVTLSPIRDGRGRVSHFVGVVTDISERKRLEEQLQTSRDQAAVESHVLAVVGAG